MNVIEHTHYRIAFQYLLKSSFTGMKKPYTVKGGVRHGVALTLFNETLPQPNHHRVELGATVTATDAQGTECFRAEVVAEAIVLVGDGLAGEALAEVLRRDVASALTGTVRAQLMAITQGTGFAAVVLPPVDSTRLASLPAPAHV